MASNGILNLTKFTHVSLPVRAKAVACGDYHTMCLSEEGQVFAWGGTLHKKTGETAKSVGVPKSEPRLVEALADRGAVIVQIDCGDFHSVALAKDGILYSWGGGGQSYNKGQCGLGHTDDAELPQMVKDLASKKVTKVAAGGFHTLALTEDNDLYAWGQGTYGELGSGNQQSVSKPQLVKMPNEVISVPSDDDPTKEVLKMSDYKPIVKMISAGGHHSLVLSARGYLYSFGYGAHG
jgi:alpha-tubulin suppressor-like RCC1 family protein